jgi:hypothetical protein
MIKNKTEKQVATITALNLLKDTIAEYNLSVQNDGVNIELVLSNMDKFGGRGWAVQAFIYRKNEMMPIFPNYVLAKHNTVEKLHQSMARNEGPFSIFRDLVKMCREISSYKCLLERIRTQDETKKTRY